MKRAVIFILVGKLWMLNAVAQEKKQFTVENTAQCQKVELNLKAKTGNCFIRPGQNDELLNIYSNQGVEEYSHSFSNEVKGQTCMVKLSLDQEDERGVGKKITYRVFGGDEDPHQKFWKVYLAENIPYSLNLDYGLGNANVDLAGLSVSKLKINTGSADVNVLYSSDEKNKVDMDTFFIKIDMGSLTARRLNNTRTKCVVADVGFGNMLLDFGDECNMSRKVKCSVGAGNMIVVLPNEDVPVIIRVSDSWLCSVQLTHGLKKIGDNTFANDAYQKNNKDVLSFDLDVSMGKIVFKEHH